MNGWSLKHRSVNAAANSTANDRGTPRPTDHVTCQSEERAIGSRC
jgi:hypothetical protein